MKKIGFVTNPEKDPTMTYTKGLADYVRELGCEPLPTGDGIAGSVAFDYMYKNADFVIVLGGDGTILRVARTAALYNVPIQGINIGTLGYLADCEGNDAREAIKNVIEDNYKTEERMMLKAEVYRRGESCYKGIALNEVYVTNSVFSRVITLGMAVNDDYIGSYRADGIIVSTPTGSTAYNLSAGGPILKPDTSLMAITQVCPHSLTSRPMVISGSDVVKIKVESSYSNAVINMDGQEGTPLEDGDEVIITASEHITRTIRTTDVSFYDILRNKMFAKI